MGLDGGEHVGFKARHPDDAVCIEGIERARGQRDGLPHDVFVGIDPQQRSADVRDEPDAVGADGNAAFVVPRRKGQPGRNPAGADIDAGESSGLAVERNPDAAEARGQAGARGGGKGDRSNQLPGTEIDALHAFELVVGNPDRVGREGHPIRRTTELDGIGRGQGGHRNPDRRQIEWNGRLRDGACGGSQQENRQREAGGNVEHVPAYGWRAREANMETKGNGQG